MAELRESVSSESMFSLTLLESLFVYDTYIPSTSKKWQKDVSDGNVKTHLVKNSLKCSAHNNMVSSCSD
jgi:hypothetical protein